MTKKDARKFRAMEIRIEELERHLAISQRDKVETFLALVDTRATLRQVYELGLEAGDAMTELMRNDPAFMVDQGKRQEVEPNF